MLEKLNNLTVAVNDIQEGIDLYCKMFDQQLMEPISAPSKYGFRTAWLGNGEDAFLELLEPTDPNSAVARFLKSHGEGVYLVSFNVENLEEAVKQVRANGGRITGLAEGEEVKPDTESVWVHPASTKGVLIGLQRSGASK